MPLVVPFHCKWRVDTFKVTEVWFQLFFWCYAILTRTSYSFMDMFLSHTIHPTTYASPLKACAQLLPSPQSFPDHIFEIRISAFPSPSLFFFFLQRVSLFQVYNIPFTGLICLLPVSLPVDIKFIRAGFSICSIDSYSLLSRIVSVCHDSCSIHICSMTEEGYLFILAHLK